MRRRIEIVVLELRLSEEQLPQINTSGYCSSLMGAFVSVKCSVFNTLFADLNAFSYVSFAKSELNLQFQCLHLEATPSITPHSVVVVQHRSTANRLQLPRTSVEVFYLLALTSSQMTPCAP